MKEQIINALDVGTANVRLMAAKQMEEKRIQVLGVGQSPCAGLRRGIVVDIEETVRSLESALEQAERASGLTIKKVFLGIDGSHLSSLTSQGAVVISRADQEVSEADIARAIEAAKAVSFPPNRQLVKVVPQSYSIDGQNGIKFPIGMSGVRLEVSTLIIEGSIPAFKNIHKCLDRVGLEIEGMILSPMAAARAVLSKRQKELGVALLDIGAGTTGLVVMEEGIILHTAILPIGGNHITNDIAIGLKSSIDLAEAIKIKISSFTGDKIDFSKIDSTEEGGVEKSQVKEIIVARLAEIFALANKELKTINRQRLLPAGVVVVGGVANTTGIADLAKEILQLSAQVGKPLKLEGLAEPIDRPEMAALTGLILSGLEERMLNPSPSQRWQEKLKDIFKKFLP